MSEPLSPPPPLTAPASLSRQMAAAGFAVLQARDVQAWMPSSVQPSSEEACGGLGRWAAPGAAMGWVPSDWRRFWDDLPADAHLRDGGRYRSRRHGCMVLRRTGSDAGSGPDGPESREARWDVELAPHRAHWQPVAYNALHGGFERWFEPLQTELAQSPALQGLLRHLADVADDLRGPQAAWFVEIHAFRIDCAQGIGRPTPEGAHRDGVDLVAVMLLAREHLKGGETRVFDARSPAGTRFTLSELGSLLLLDDERVIHETTPIQPLATDSQPDAQSFALRDTLVVTLRRGGFQGPT